MWAYLLILNVLRISDYTEIYFIVRGTLENPWICLQLFLMNHAQKMNIIQFLGHGELRIF